MKQRLITVFFYLGLLFLTIGTLFKIQHWPYGRLCQSAGVLSEIIFFIMAILEIFNSKKATSRAKIAFVLIYAILPIVFYLYLPAIILIFAILILGSVYLTRIRRQVFYTRAEMILKNFDSI